ncbi:MAG TPA: hypothetical protein PKN80_02610 [bacterium]|uniref:Spore protein YkvP/CgeB glycosyl transferase-like domain-containing protein n=1 Tax=candidate division TA06 bacterium ADurb.Bin417 TaxID=1852828 RepID=A0A1V5MCX9_UNCT6|nr:MAG: hypothetical protein BWY73_01245 [candidate division TA06 bacterium ADurb.Bin417]HNQ34937.1 hypothetical protein [bacterium]HNS49304.1 hypothetical protein [bacterium]
MNQRVLHLPVNISNQAWLLVRGLRETGWSADALFYRSNRFAYQGAPAGLLDRPGCGPAWFESLRAFLARAGRYDIFHFHFGHTFFSNPVDLELLRRLGKVTLMHYWGSDIRFYSRAGAANPRLRERLPAEARSERKKARRARRVAGRVRACLSADLELDGYLAPFFRRRYRLPQALDPGEYPCAPPPARKARPLVLHSPSNPGLKGSDFISRAVESLRASGRDFDFVQLQGVPNRQVRAALKEADIVIDQLLLGTYGIFALEAMASGKPVICFINPGYRPGYPDDLPLVSAGPDDLRAVLAGLLDDGAGRFRLGEAGRAYVERHHDFRRVAERLVGIYQDLCEDPA